MKKILTLLVCAALTSVCAVAADAAAPEAAPSQGFACGIWFNCPDGINKTNVDGLGIGLPILSCGNFNGAAISLCANITKETSGFQGTLIGFNNAEKLDGMQLSFVNLHGGVKGDFGLQVGIYNQSSKQGLQFGLFNNGRDNATFQVGLLNINKNGLFPVMIFVNFGKALANN